LASANSPSDMSNLFLLSSNNSNLVKKHFNLIKSSKSSSILDELKLKGIMNEYFTNQPISMSIDNIKSLTFYLARNFFFSILGAHYSKIKTTKTMNSHLGMEMGDYNNSTLSSTSTATTPIVSLSTSSTNSNAKTVPYLNRTSGFKKIDSMTNPMLASLVGTSETSTSLSPYTSKIFSNSSNNLNSSASPYGSSTATASSSFFKRSIFSSSSNSSTITGKSTNIKRDVGIKAS
jgi:hypothetical protein